MKYKVMYVICDILRLYLKCLAWDDNMWNVDNERVSI